MLETAALGLRAVHIAAGAVALAVFWIPLVVTKGNTVHRRAGKIYVWAMFTVAATALAIAPVRMLQRPVGDWPFPIFLAFVAFLSFTSAFYGVRVLKQKQRAAPNGSPVDLAAPALLLAACLAMLAYAVSIGFTLGMVFVPLGLLVAIRQLLTLRGVPSRKTWWLTEHLGAMIISTIATITAFLVVNLGTGGLFLWLAPTAVGVPLIIYWRRTYQKA